MAIGTAIGLGAAGAIAATINAVSQHDTNKQMMSYQTSERVAAQEYNNPVNQRKRFEASGINPYFALGQIDAGNTTAQASPNLSAPQYGDILNSLASGASQGYDIYQQEQISQQLQLGIEQMKVDTRYKLTQKLLDISEQRIRIENSNLDKDAKAKEIAMLDKQATRLQQDIDFTNQTWDERKATVVAQRKLAENEADARELGNDYQRMVNSWFPDMQQAQLDAINSSVETNLASAIASRAAAGLSTAQAATECSNKIVKDLEAKGMKLDQSMKRGLYKFTREAMQLDNENKRLANKNSELEARSLQIGPIKIKPSAGVAAYKDRINASDERRKRKAKFNSPQRLNYHLSR